MTTTQLQGALSDAGVSKHAYSFHGPGMGECYCITRGQSGWETFYSERGAKRSLRVFETEDEACQHFLDWILADSTTKEQL